jgi:autotransporter-associated beta strand protein
MLYSVAPATFTVNQNSDTLFNGVITGAVSIVKLGTGTLTLTNKFISTFGSFTVSNGALNIADQGTLGVNSTNIVVGGTGTLVISNSLAIADVATIQMPTNSVSTAKINLAEGVDERVGWLYFGGKMQNAGTYGSNDSPATYKDNTHFAGKGVLTVRFDEFGTVLIVR